MNVLRPTLLMLAVCLAQPAPAASDLPALGDASSAIISPEQEHQLAAQHAQPGAARWRN